MTLLGHLDSTSLEPSTPKKVNKMNNLEFDQENNNDLHKETCCFDLNCSPESCVINNNTLSIPSTPEKKNEVQQSHSSESNQEDDDQEKISQEFDRLDGRVGRDELGSTQESCVVNPSPVDLCSSPIRDKGIDLNEKPRKKFRRKKHRPKVVKELGQQKTSSKPNVTREPRKEKRKYVRRKNPLHTPSLDELGEIYDVNECGRSLNSSSEYKEEEIPTKRPRTHDEDPYEQCTKSADSNGVERMLYVYPSVYAGCIDDYIPLGANNLQPTRRELIRANLRLLSLNRDDPEVLDKHHEATAKRRVPVFGKTTRKLKRTISKKLRKLAPGNQDYVKYIQPLVDELAYLFAQLTLSDEIKALVPFKGDGKMIPYMGIFDPTKKKKRLKPKVALDEASLKVWNFLMGKREADPSEDNEKWWEEERELFWKKMESIIIRMHHIQGDRRFSPWYGSVLDSVMGVFLTQNAADVQSSYAYLTLKALFPVRNDNTTTEEPEVEFPDADDNVIQSASSSQKFPEYTSTSKADEETENDWEHLRKATLKKYGEKKRTKKTMDSVDWEAVRCADYKEIADAIKERGTQDQTALKIQAFLNRLVEEHGTLDMEWLRDAPPEKAKEYLLSFFGLGLKSVECIRLLCLLQQAFPVDTNVGRIASRLGWVPLQPLPGGMQFHLLELYPNMDMIQKYLWPRLCKLDHAQLYELHYQLITFGKVFCTKIKPNCNACPMKAECKHFASAYESARLTGTEEQSVAGSSAVPPLATKNPALGNNPLKLLPPEIENIVEARTLVRSEASVQVLESPDIIVLDDKRTTTDCIEPLIEIPASPELPDIEDFGLDEDPDEMDPEEIPLIKFINTHNYTLNMHNCSHTQDLQDSEMSKVLKALAILNPQIASIPTPKLKNVWRLRTEHQVYELPDSHPLLSNVS
ncbi:hypothetical protein ACHQM5_022481 [Ranunculus cassubicifolius]